MCLGSLSCMNRWSGSLFLINGTSVVSSTLQKRSASMMPSKIQILVAPWRLIPPPPPPPDMNFERVLRFRLSLGGLICHPEACTVIRLKRNRALIAKNHVVESVSTLQNTLCELQPLHFVRIPNQLAIGGLLQSPALLLSRSSYRGRTHANSTFCQLLLDLGTGHLVILAHLLIYQGSCFDTDSFLGLLERGKFATEPVRRSFLIMRVMLERLTTKPSPFKVFNIPAGWRPWLWRSSIRVLT